MRRPTLLAGVIVLGSACGGGGKPKPPPDAAPPKACTVSLAGTLSADQTIAKGCTATVTEDVTVAAGTLTVEAGAKILFLDGRSLTVGPTDPAKLVVAGTAEAPVVFALAGEGLPGNWGQVHLGKGAAGSSIAGLALDHAGKDGKSALWVEAPDVSITGSTVKDVAGVGIELAPELGFGAFTRNKIEGAAKELLRVGPEAAGALGEGNTFAPTGVIAVVPGTLTRSVTWRDLGAPYLIADMLQVEMKGKRATLTLDAGVEVRFTVKAGLGIGVGQPGGLKIAGTPSAPVILTSADAQPGSWNLWIGRQGEAVIENAVVAFGGTDHDAGAIAVRGGSLEVYKTSFHDDVVGLSVDDKATIAVDGCSFEKTSVFAIALFTQLGALGSNTYDGGAKIELRGGTVAGAVTWRPQAKVWWSGKVAVEGELTIEAGGDFTMMDKAALHVGSTKKKGKPGLAIRGTPAQPVKMIGVRASPGSWGNLVLTGAQESVIENLQLAGTGGDAAIAVGDGARVALKNVTCEQCTGAVVTRTCGGQITLDGVKAGAGTPTTSLEPACQTISVPAAPTK